MKNTGIYDLHGEYINEAYQSGKTLQQIGNELGVTRERIRQILNTRFDGTKREGCVSTAAVAKEFGISADCLREKVKGILTSGGNRNLLWAREDIEKAREILTNICWCGKEVFLFKYCSNKCYRERWKYKNKSLEGKRVHDRAARNWTQNNPERAKEIRKKAADNYRDKNLQKTWYKILRKNSYGIPVGEIVKCMGRGKSSFVYVEYNGAKYFLNTGTVRRIRDERIS